MMTLRLKESNYEPSVLVLIKKKILWRYLGGGGVCFVLGVPICWFKIISLLPVDKCAFLSKAP